ncbi:hypothetical protein [Actinomadura mexicana]|uniref:Uncharacterized protein n=1 Tax=Actinomadura mexicana TaxID=134959 RepID=A0A239ACM2_9ACTN|nr:hypothetical protein [Actinomadura mexicana]SNR92794.1 hypothetical protein SAMN06265355_108327 [Actinomadura mexicana]
MDAGAGQVHVGEVPAADVDLVGALLRSPNGRQKYLELARTGL